jgi:hypothetical protein
MDGFEPKVSHYTGACRTTAKLDGLTVDREPFRVLAKMAWPDVRLPTQFAVMPAEDYEVMLGDLTGQPMTPHRCPVYVPVAKPSEFVAKEEWPPLASVLDGLARLVGKITLWALAFVGFLTIFRLI